MATQGRAVERVMAETRHRIAEAGLKLAGLTQQWDVDSIDDWRRYTAQAKPLICQLFQCPDQQHISQEIYRYEFLGF